jgi:hypothetical protein
MYVSCHDPLNSVFAWFQARTDHADRPQRWTAEADLYLDYHAHAEASGIAPSRRVARSAFAAELQALMHRMPQQRLARPVNGGLERLLPFWPRSLRPVRALAAA